VLAYSRLLLIVTASVHVGGPGDLHGVDMSCSAFNWVGGAGQ